MAEPIVLRGITWEHDRGLAPLVATAEAYAERDPSVRIDWDVRSLQAFADQAVDALAERFDLIVLDHPSIGFAVARGCLVPLDEQLDAAYLADQRDASVGRSFESYVWDGHVWALPNDAAAQVASARPDLLERLGCELPATWDDVLSLAQRGRTTGVRVAIPSIAVDALLSYFAVCVADGADPFDGPDEVRTGALERLGAIAAVSYGAATSWNPPATYEHMASRDDVVYCPLGFGYSNYARPGYREHRLVFTPGPAGPAGTPSGTLGGAGIAVSARSPAIEAACAYAAFVASPDVQRGAYVEAGGQPGHRSAWSDDHANAMTQGYFRATLLGLDAAYLRPRYDGYLEFQDLAGDAVHAYLRDGGDARRVVDTLDALRRTTEGTAAG